MIVAYTISESTLPKSVSLAGFRRALHSAMDAVTKAAMGHLTFEDSDEDERPNIVFRFGKVAPPAIAWWKQIDVGYYTVTFNATTSWGTSAWQFWRFHSLRTFAIHEILHVLGLYRPLPNQPVEIDPHNNDKGSVMHAYPQFATITDNDRLLLLTATRKEKLT